MQPTLCRWMYHARNVHIPCTDSCRQHCRLLFPTGPVISQDYAITPHDRDVPPSGSSTEEHQPGSDRSYNAAPLLGRRRRQTQYGFCAASGPPQTKTCQRRREAHSSERESVLFVSSSPIPSSAPLWRSSDALSQRQRAAASSKHALKKTHIMELDSNPVRQFPKRPV